MTAGDLRRLVLRGSDEDMHAPIATVMTKDPRALPATALVRDALLMIRERRQDESPVVNDDGQPVDVEPVKPVKLYTLSRTSCLSILYALFLVAKVAASYQPLLVARPAAENWLHAFPIG